MGQVLLATPKEVHAWIEQDAVHLIDVREVEEHQQLRIDAGLNLPLSLLNADCLRGYEGSPKKIVFYCRSAKRSQFACEELLPYAGGVNLYNMSGGILEWEYLGLPVLSD